MIKNYILHPLTALVVGGFFIGLGIDLHRHVLLIPGIALALYSVAMGLKWVAVNLD